jgi:hypothetical protein
MVLKCKRLQTFQIKLSTPERLNDMLLHKTYIEAKTKKHLQQANAYWDTSNTQNRSSTTQPHQDPLPNLKTIKRLGEALRSQITTTRIMSSTPI